MADSQENPKKVIVDQQKPTPTMVQLSEEDAYTVINWVQKLPLEQSLQSYIILINALKKAFPDRII